MKLLILDSKSYGAKHVYPKLFYASRLGAPTRWWIDLSIFLDLEVLWVQPATIFLGV